MIIENNGLCGIRAHAGVAGLGGMVLEYDFDGNPYWVDDGAGYYDPTADYQAQIDAQNALDQQLIDQNQAADYQAQIDAQNALDQQLIDQNQAAADYQAQIDAQNALDQQLIDQNQAAAAASTASTVLTSGQYNYPSTPNVPVTRPSVPVPSATPGFNGNATTVPAGYQLNQVYRDAAGALWKYTQASSGAVQRVSVNPASLPATASAAGTVSIGGMKLSTATLGLGFAAIAAILFMGKGT